MEDDVDFGLTCATRLVSRKSMRIGSDEVLAGEPRDKNNDAAMET